MSKHYAEFRVGDLFEVVTGSIVKDLKKGDTPRINPTEQNNGIGSWTEGDNDLARYFEDFVSVSFLGNVFYQKQRSSLEMKVHGLKRKGESFGDRKGQYVASSVYKAVTGIYDYGMQLSSEKLKDLLITLPITDASANTDSPEPDWEYMESYIKSIEEKYLDSVEEYNRKNEEILDVLHPDYPGEAPEAYDYAEFKVGELFEVNIERGDISSQGDLVDDPDGVSFVAQNDGNNGFVKRIDQEEHKIFSSGSICVGRQTGVVYYQPYDFATTDGVLVIEIKKNRKIGMYVVSSLSKALTGSGYTNTVSAKSLKETSITLPITPSGEPDWLFMEEYISFIEGGRRRIENYVQSKRRTS